MSLENAVALVLAVAVLAYLVYALLRRRSSDDDRSSRSPWSPCSSSGWLSG